VSYLYCKCALTELCVSYVLAVNLNSGHIAPWSDRSTLYRQIVKENDVLNVYINLWKEVIYNHALPFSLTVFSYFLNSLPRLKKIRAKIFSFPLETGGTCKLPSVVSTKLNSIAVQ